MFHKSKGWISGSGGSVFKPKNPHSLEHLKYLYGVLCKNQTVTDQNLSLLVETLRSISEILIWGDQNDSSVFDFFLEKNMLVFFLKFMRQKTAQCICVQLLQTLNILFDNITNETSVYYLLSNNHINSIIVHKFDFSDEEVMAYYISFLKTLSMKLNKHTIHFFYNEHTNDFALYTEAIKFFNHGESMVRIAVRTITLNVYRACVPLSKSNESSEHCVEDKSMLQYIKEKTAAPYFSNLVKFIGQHVLELNTCVKHDIDHNNKCKLADLVAEHLDHLHYLNDILCLEIDILNETLTEHLLNSLFIPLYIDSLLQPTSSPQLHLHVDQVVSLFLLSQVFLIIHHVPLVRELADIIFMRDTQEDSKTAGVSKPTESCETHFAGELSKTESKMSYDETNSTDEEKLLRSGSGLAIASIIQNTNELNNPAKPYLSTIFLALDCTKDDYKTLLALCLLYALGHNKGVNMKNLSMLSSHSTVDEAKENYNSVLIQQFINIMSLACQSGSKVRLATLELCALFVKSIAWKDEQCILQDGHLAAIEGVREEATLLLRNFYKVWQKSEEIFLDMFEDEHRELTTRPLNVEHLMMDASILLSPIGTPLTGIDFCKRLPCGEVERARRAIRLFFIVRGLSFTLRKEVETALPLTKESECVKINDVLDLNNSDLIACTIVHDEKKKERRFLVIDVIQLILVEPDSKRLGWGIVRFSGFLQDTEVMGDKDDSRCLLVTIHRPPSSSLSRPIPILSSKFIFDDHIRCMAARQRLTKGRLKARQRKMQMIARMLDMPSQLVESIYIGPTSSDIGRLDVGRPSSASHSSAFHPGQAQRRRAFKESEGKNTLLGKLINTTILDNTANPNFRSPIQGPTSVKQSIFASVDQVPGFNLVASEQEHDKRSRKLKAKLADSIAKHQAVRSTPVCSDELPICSFSVSPQSGVESKKKMFLSMAKEAKQRSLQQESQRASLPSSDQTLLQLSLQISDESRERATAKLAKKCHHDNLKNVANDEATDRRESSSLPIIRNPQPSAPAWSDKSINAGSLDSKLEHIGPSLVSRLRIRAHSESAERSIVKSEESRSSVSMLPKNVFVSLMSPLTKKSPKYEFPLELEDAKFSESLKTEEKSSNAENIL